MDKNKVMLILTHKGKKYIVFAVVTLLIVICLNAGLFAFFSANILEGKSIIIDPGHGGIDPGTNDASGFFEKDINLQISHKLHSELQNNKCIVNMTREDDRSLDSLISSANIGRHQKDLMARVEKFNRGAYDLFISIHVNRSSNVRATGPMVLYSPNSFENKFLAYCLQSKLNAHMKQITGKDFVRKSVASSFYILKNSDIPGVIVETGFISNPVDKKNLTEEQYQQKLSMAICEGIKEYFKSVEKAKANGNSQDELMDEQESQPFNITNDIRLVGK